MGFRLPYVSIQIVEIRSHLPHPVFGASDGEGLPARAQAILLVPGRALARMRRAAAWLDRGPIGHAIGAASVFVTPLGILVMLEAFAGVLK